MSVRVLHLETRGHLRGPDERPAPVVTHRGGASHLEDSSVGSSRTGDVPRHRAAASGSEAARPAPPSRSRSVTGGGLVGIVDPRRGLRGLWAEESDPGIALDVRIGEGALSTGGRLVTRKGRWSRDIRFSDGSLIRERGLLPDVIAVPVIEWTRLQGGEAIPIRIRVGSEGAAQLSLGADDRATVAILPPDADEGRARTLLRPLEARERQRERRGGDENRGALRVLMNGIPSAPLHIALEQVDDAALDAFGLFGASRPGTERFLAGIADGIPRFLDAAGRAELALAVLGCGRHGLAERLLGSVLDASNAPPLASVHLAAAFALWTGKPHRLEAHAARLVELAGSLADRTDPTPAFLPTPRRAVAELRHALEPLGELEWIQRLTDPTGAHGGASSPDPPRSGSRTLPVVGSVPPPPSDTGESDRPARVPPIVAFGDPDAPGWAGRRTQHAARLLRSWIEGVLGARPDGSFGRLTLAPKVRSEWDDLAVEGLRIADASVRIGYRRRGATHTFSIRQTTGRVPLNMVFEPELPIPRIRAVRIGDESADVEITRHGGTSSIRCQFPLDPDREVTVVGDE